MTTPAKNDAVTEPAVEVVEDPRDARIRELEAETTALKSSKKGVKPNKEGIVFLADLPHFEFEKGNAKQPIMPDHSEHFAEGGNLFCVTCEENTPSHLRDAQGNGARVLVPCPGWVTVQ